MKVKIVWQESIKRECVDIKLPAPGGRYELTADQEWLPQSKSWSWDARYRAKGLTMLISLYGTCRSKTQVEKALQAAFARLRKMVKVSQ